LIINLFNEGLYYRSSLSMTELKKKNFPTGADSLLSFK